MAGKSARRYSQVLYTPEQETELKALYQKAVEVGRNPDSTPQERVETLAAAQRLELRLYREARARYRDSFAGDYARIMEALRHDIAATTKDEYNAYIKQSREQADKVKAAFMAQHEGKPAQEVQEEYNRTFGGTDQAQRRFARRNYTGYFRFLESYAAIYKDALKAAGLPLEEYAAALDAAAAAAYPKSPRIIYFQTRPRPRPEWEQVTLEEYAQRLSGQEVQEAEPQPLQEITPEELEAAADPLFITAVQANILEYPLDKPNSALWNYLDTAAHADQNGQIGFAVERSGSGKEITTYYSIDFEAIEGLTVSKVLTPYDKRVYIATAGLHAAGNEVVTASQIHIAMGNTTRPSPAQIDKINASIDKMAFARITLDNTQEATAFKKEKILFKYDGYLLPCERVSAYINGQLSDTAIHLLRVPPLISFAKQRGQITTIPIKLLASPISKTEDNLIIEDYLLERIFHMKNGKAKNKILYKTLFSACRITGRKQQERARKDKIPRYLDYYKQEHEIKGYTVDADGITISL